MHSSDEYTPHEWKTVLSQKGQTQFKNLATI